MKIIFCIVFALAFNSFGIANKENSSFVATHEWQEIKEGQGIPAGLHVRINLQTGKKEAKILDENESNASNEQGGALAAVPEDSDGTKGTAKHKLKLSKKLSEALKKIPKDDALRLEHTPEQMEKIIKKYKSYADIKESFANIQKSFTTDAEIITQLIGQYRNATQLKHNDEKTIQVQHQILNDFNQLVHQIDNAMFFIDDGGLEHVLLPLVVNQTNVGLRVKAMRVLGALTQNNPKAQIKVFERNFGSHLSQILTSSSNTDELSTALYAFGSLLRKFPHAQHRILSTCGTQALIAVLSKECDLKIKAKAMTIISDLVFEKLSVIEMAKNTQSSSTGDDPMLAAAQYAELNYPEWFQIHSYCETVDSLLNNKLYELIEQPDITEYFAQALQTTHSNCASIWSQSPQLRHTLLSARNRLQQSSDEYQIEVAQQLDSLINIIYANLHEEL